MDKSVRSMAVAIAALLAASEAAAHARLLNANPPINESAPAPGQIVLTFSEKLQPKFSGFTATRGGTPVPMKVSIGKDRRTLVGAPIRSLTPGAYHVVWRAVTADTHRIKGSYTFTVR